ncbi:MAG: hypothetical protein ACR2MY_03060 [Candidatus Dormibacteria bacterium]
MSDPKLHVVESPGPYVYFVISAFALTLLAGPLVGALLWASQTGPGNGEGALIEAHGWAQLLGWAGIFVAGFSLRLVPRFAGRPERSASQAIAVLALLVAGVLLRLVGQVVGPPLGWMVAVGGGTAAVGMMGVASSLVATLRNNRHGLAPWSLLAWFGSAWWVMWAGLSVVTGWVAASKGIAPEALDRSATWVVILGAIGNFIWAVQSRMVPVSFGRTLPSVRAVIVPAVAYNLGVLAILGSIPVRYFGGLPSLAAALSTAGLAVSAIAIGGLGITCGAVTGRAHRLRPASQPLGRFITWANRWALLAGLLLLLYSTSSVLPRAVSRLQLEDAALHALASGTVTILIAGMLQLVAPIFAMERLGPGQQLKRSEVVWVLLMAAAACRVLAALLRSLRPAWFAPLAGISGLTGWVGLALLAAAIVGARVRLAGGARPTSG